MYRVVFETPEVKLVPAIARNLADTFVYIIGIKSSKLNFTRAQILLHPAFPTEFACPRKMGTWTSSKEKKASNVAKTSVAILKIHEIRGAPERANGRASSWFEQH